jgi:hypothetical protein
MQLCRAPSSQSHRELWGPTKKNLDFAGKLACQAPFTPKSLIPIEIEMNDSIRRKAYPVNRNQEEPRLTSPGSCWLSKLPQVLCLLIFSRKPFRIKYLRWSIRCKSFIPKELQPGNGEGGYPPPPAKRKRRPRSIAALPLHERPKRCRWSKTPVRPARSSWCGRTCPAAHPPARRCERRRSPAAPAAGSPANVPSGSRRKTPARSRTPASERPPRSHAPAPYASSSGTCSTPSRRSCQTTGSAGSDPCRTPS